MKAAARVAAAAGVPHVLSPRGMLEKELIDRKSAASKSVLIGFVESGQWDRLAERQGLPVSDVHRSLVETVGIPLGRVGRAEEFADLAAFLVSPRAAYISGTAINFDGGASPAS